MSDCTELRDLMGPVLDNEATPEQTRRLHAHLEHCADCAALFDAMTSVVGAGAVMDRIDPPPGLADELSASPCRRWLGLLYQAVDREISQSNLERLLTHLESCRACRQVWQDLTLIHQVGDAMKPPEYLLRACIEVRNTVARLPILGRRTATAAAYILALVTSLAIGNPTIIAQDLQETAVQRVSRAANGVSEVAADGRGEVRVLLWRTMQWGEARVAAVRGWIDQLRGGDTDTDQTDNSSEHSLESSSQGESP